jgi:glycosyltransferase involved in cell wall biosynthesis
MKRYHHRVVDAVVGVGEGILSAHLRLGYFQEIPEHLRRVIWNPAVVDGIGPDYVKPSLTGEPLTFGYLGRINIEKGVGTLLGASRRLPANGWKLLIAGREASAADNMRSLAQGLPVEFLGFVSPRELFDRIDVLVVPSIWAEPLPRSILEAYAAGVPVIGANSGGIPDLIGMANKDWLFPAANAVALAEIMHRVMLRGRSLLPPRLAFQHVLAKTEPSKVVQQYDELYAELWPSGLRAHAFC